MMPREALDKQAMELVEEAQHKKIASMLIAGNNLADIAKELKTTTYKVSRVTKTDEFKDHLRELTDSLVTTASNSWKAAMSERVSAALKVIDFHLNNNDLEAVKLLMKSIGIEKPEQQIQSGALTVVLPSFEQPKPVDIEVK